MSGFISKAVIVTANARATAIFAFALAIFGYLTK